LWPKRIPRGKLTLLIGDPGLGKSYLTLDICARVTRGGTWPDGSGMKKARNVIILSAEDGVADTIRQRLDVLNARPKRIFVLNVDARPFGLRSHLKRLEREIVRRRVRLVIIDPLTAYLGRKTDAYKEADVRGLLTPLIAMAERHSVAVIAVMHLGKKEQQTILYRALGSIGFIAAARTAFLVAKEPVAGSNRRVFAAVKSNIGPKPDTLAFTIDSDGLHWDNKPVSFDAEMLMTEDAEYERSKLDFAIDFLKNYLKNGPILSKDVRRTAKENGISERTFDRAVKAAGVKSGRLVGLGSDGYWTMTLPDVDKQHQKRKKKQKSNKKK
jgi:archaellum biogenesis ATPase FlaH